MASYVLVVDDEEAVRALLLTYLESWGYIARDAAGAIEALDWMELEPASVAVIDVRMPVHDGVWLAEQIRQRWPGTAIIIITGAGELTSDQANRIGVFDFVRKPIDHVLLRELIGRASRPRGEGGAGVS